MKHFSYAGFRYKRQFRALTCIGRSKFRPRGGGKTGHRGGHWPETGATKSYTKQFLRTFWPMEPSVLEACILRRRSGLNLDRPLQAEASSRLP
jgi:hypothetical protein